jgi:hypothetical protein
MLRAVLGGLAIQSVCGACALWSTRRSTRAFWVVGLLLVDLAFVVTGVAVEIRGVVAHIRQSEGAGGRIEDFDGLLAALRQHVWRGAAFQAALTSWLAVLAIVPLRPWTAAPKDKTGGTLPG